MNATMFPIATANPRYGYKARVVYNVVFSTYLRSNAAGKKINRIQPFEAANIFVQNHDKA